MQKMHLEPTYFSRAIFESLSAWFSLRLKFENRFIVNIKKILSRLKKNKIGFFGDSFLPPVQYSLQTISDVGLHRISNFLG